MAGIRKDRDKWYARIRWTDEDGKPNEERIPLKTDKKHTALLRRAEVNKVEDAIKAGITFSFPWIADNLVKIAVKHFTLADAINEWISGREKKIIGNVRKNTLSSDKEAFRYLLNCIEDETPINQINDKHIEKYIEYLRSRENGDVTINIRLRAIKTMFMYFRKINKIDKMPNIDQLSISYKEPIYISDIEFKSILDLPEIDSFYKRVFCFYRDTGLRLREPFISTLNGDWIDIPPESKTHAERSIKLTYSLRENYIELMEWKMNGYGSKLLDPGEHLSKKFKKAMRLIKASEIKRFHSLRHTFAVRKLLLGVSIYELKLLMGHKSVTTTETYSNMNLRRVRQDFPTIGQSFAKTPDFTDLGHGWRDTRRKSPVFQDSRIPH